MSNNKGDYLLVIWEFLEASGKITGKDISDRLNISPPTVSEYLNKLEQEDLISKDGRYIQFTSNGFKQAIPLVRMHRISEVFAYKMLEIPWEESHKSVMELEHIFNSDTGEKLYKNLGSPDKCPHGNPVEPTRWIPDKSAFFSDTGKYVISRVSFEDHDFLKQLASINAFPREKVVLIKGDDIVLETSNGSMKLDPVMAQSLRLARP